MGSVDLQADTITDQEIKEPSLYNVVMHNDDVTTFEFVIYVLQEVFNKQFQDSLIIAQAIHEKGQQVIDTFTKEVALQKVDEASSIARINGFPLVLTAEEN